MTKIKKGMLRPSKTKYINPYKTTHVHANIKDKNSLTGKLIIFYRKELTSIVKKENFS